MQTYFTHQAKENDFLQRLKKISAVSRIGIGFVL